MSGPPYTLTRSQLVPRHRAEVFAFFSRPENLELLTPPFLRFRILTPSPVPMAEGTLIDYRLSLGGIPFAWRTLIREYRPEGRFVDVQVRGPYAMWEHTHTFEERAGGTEVGDRVAYALPMGPLGTLAHALWVRRTLDRIFDYRREAVTRFLG